MRVIPCRCDVVGAVPTEQDANLFLVFVTRTDEEHDQVVVTDSSGEATQTFICARSLEKWAGER